MKTVFQNVRYTPIRTLLAAVFTAVVLLAPSAGVVRSVIDEPLGWGSYIIAVTVTDMILCMFLGLGCFMLGYVVAAVRRDWSKPQPLLGFAAALSLIVFTLLALGGALWRGGPPPGRNLVSDFDQLPLIQSYLTKVGSLAAQRYLRVGVIIPAKPTLGAPVMPPYTDR